MKSFKERIKELSYEKKSRLILALDVFKRDEALNFLKPNMADKLVSVKMNLPLLLSLSIEEIRELTSKAKGELNLLTIADIKLNDIAYTNLNTAKLLWENGFDALIVNPIAGYEDGLKPLIETSKKLGKGIINLVYMSHKGTEDFYSYLYEKFLTKSLEWEVDGIIVGATNLKILSNISRRVGGKLLIFSPGIGAQGGKVKEALKNGSDFIIVGRSILDSREPESTAEKIRQESWF
ncbi:MAG: orotidine-5'-phosphate decarboxylase [Nitrososphaerales archaeon]